MRKVIALAGAALVLAAGAALAAAAPTTLSFVSVTGHQTQTKNGFGQSDTDFVGKTKVGTDQLNCIAAKNQKVANCKVTVTRPEGTVVGSLSLNLAGNQTHGPLKVVGGTGTYKGATGTGTFKNLNKSGSRTAVTLNLA